MPDAPSPIPLDCLIIGGGVAGLFLLDAAVAAGHRTLLLEANALGFGQTIASQGIIHGGLKYALDGSVGEDAAAVADMPDRWRACLSGASHPDLRAVALRSDHCHIWHTTSVRSRIAWIGARLALRVTPTVLDQPDRPPPLRDCPGTVARLNEQVIDPASLLETLAAAHQRRLLRIAAGSGVEFDGHDGGRLVRLIDPRDGEPMDLAPSTVVLCAGAGNEELRSALGLAADAQQVRPLHMTLLRGDLPALNGHCVDGAATRVTITTTADAAGRTIWQVGGAAAEDGIDRTSEDQARHVAAELAAVLPALDLRGIEFATHLALRSEGAEGGRRPAHCQVLRDGDVLTCWPTKLALAPLLADEVVSALGASSCDGPIESAALATWPRPAIATPPWDTDLAWMTLDEACSGTP